MRREFDFSATPVYSADGGLRTDDDQCIENFRLNTTETGENDGPSVRIITSADD
jgi:hypothetical protein